MIGTTGWDEERVAALARLHELPVFYAPNFSLGGVLMMRFAEEAAKLLQRAEIVELHHDTKADGVDRDVAHQEVIFGGPGETLTIRHDTTSRDAFAPGVLRALERVRDLPPGLTVGLDAIV